MIEQWKDVTAYKLLPFIIRKFHILYAFQDMVDFISVSFNFVLVDVTDECQNFTIHD